MRGKVLIIGSGDAGIKIADGLARSGKVAEITLADLRPEDRRTMAGMLDSCYDCEIKFTELDALQQKNVEQLIKREKPDVVVQSASLLSPWALYGRTDQVANALYQAGLGIQLPAQLPILTSVMKAVREVDFNGPVVNLSYPDVANPILDRFDLAPAIGLGNISIIHLRVRAAIRKKKIKKGTFDGSFPLIRLIGHHNQVYSVMKAEIPDDPNEYCRVYLGADGQRADELAYQGYPITPGIDFNVITAAAALPPILALLPGAKPLCFSVPAPMGLPGGYPVIITDGHVGLDLPQNANLQEAVDYQWQIARHDGVKTVTEDGTVLFSDKAVEAVKSVDPRLSEPLKLEECWSRWQLLLGYINS